MLSLDIPEIEELLGKLDCEGYIFPQYQLYKKEDKLVLLGKGGFSYVYEIFKRNEPEKRYALKVMGFHRHTMSTQVFRRTVDLQRMLSEQSEHVVRIINAKSVWIILDGNGKFFNAQVLSEESGLEQREGFVLQFVLMEKLQPIITRDRFGNVTLTENGLYTEEKVIELAKQIGTAIAVAHDNNVLHRDIKLENIFFDTKTKKYMLGDFGIAKYVESGAAETVVYTDGYGAPEIERRLTGKYNAAADIYSYGVTLYLLLNDLCFPASEGYRVNPVQYSLDYVFPAPKNASPLLAAIVQNMCCYNSAERYVSAKDVLAELEKMNTITAVPDAVTEYPDLETETYRESISKKKSGKKEEVDEKSRAFRKVKKQKENQYYRTASLCIAILMALCTLFYVKSMGTSTDYISHPLFWLMPIALLIQAVLSEIKEFHWIFGIIVAGLVLYSAVAYGCSTVHIVMLLSLLSGAPVLIAAVAVGVGAWMLWEGTGLFADVALLQNGHFAWFFLVVLLLAIDHYIRLGWLCGRRTKKTVDRWFAAYRFSHKILIAIGIVVGVLQLTGIFIISHPWKLIQLGMVGLVLLVVSKLQSRY